MFAHEDGGPEPDWIKTEREQFADFRDLNKDGKMDLDEIRHWIMPQDYDHAQAEARHLVYESDQDKVRPSGTVFSLTPPPLCVLHPKQYFFLLIDSKHPFFPSVGSIVDQTGDPGQLEHVCGKPGHQLRRRPHQEPRWALSSSRNSDACVCVCFWVRGGSWNSSHPPAPLRQPLRPLDGCQRFWTVKHRWRREKERGSVLPLSESDHLNFVCLFVFSSHGFCFWHSGAEPDAAKHLLCHQQCLSSQRGRSSVGNLSTRDKLYLTPLRYRHSFWRRQCETQWGTLYRFYLFIRCLLNFKRTAALNKRFSKTGHEMCFCVYALPCQVFFMCLFYYFFGPVLYVPEVSCHVFCTSLD